MPAQPYTKNLRLTVAKSGVSGSDYYIDGIPQDVWDQFTRKSKEIFPDSGETAWSNILTEVIAAFCEGETQSLILTDIPGDAWKALYETTKQINASIPQTVATLFARSAEGRMHLLKFSRVNPETKMNEDPPGHMFLVYNLPEEYWEKWLENASIGGWTGEQMLGMIFEETAKGNLRVTSRAASPTIHGEQSGLPGRPAAPETSSGNVTRARFPSGGSR